MTFICYPKCTTCQKAQKWLDENGISYTFRDIKMENPTYEELSAWHQRSGLHGGGHSCIEVAFTLFLFQSYNLLHSDSG